MQMLYYLSGGDPLKIKDLENVSLEYIYSFYYLRRVERLNQALAVLPVSGEEPKGRS